ncbi:MAG TPA: acetone carboxylase subunit gamma [Solirubrobacteraceae bacterium]|jgi:acetophenone carboxylase|nr:acetone carboxylase subunit gamma [Solirubrobacteraceae bacterium]
MRRRVTESLDLDTEALRWACHECGGDLGPAAENYKTHTLVRARDPHEIWQPAVDEPFTFSYHPDWMRLVEFYCPGCGLMLDCEVLPPGHPVTHDIELDLDALRTTT